MIYQFSLYTLSMVENYILVLCTVTLNSLDAFRERHSDLDLKIYYQGSCMYLGESRRQAVCFLLHIGKDTIDRSIHHALYLVPQVQYFSSKRQDLNNIFSSHYINLKVKNYSFELNFSKEISNPLTIFSFSVKFSL